MSSELYSSLSPDEVALRLQNERVEHDFGPPSEPRPMIQRGNKIPEASSPSRCSDEASLPVGMLLYLASVAVRFWRPAVDAARVVIETSNHLACS